MKFFLTFLMFTVSIAQAGIVHSQNYMDHFIEEYKIDHIETCEEGFIITIDDNIFINTQGIQTTSNGIFLLENGSWISLSDIMADQDNYTWTCRNCGARNPQGTSSCLRCRNPR